MSSIHNSTCNATGGGGCIVKEVPAVTCADLIRRHGTPILLKIDIEGADRLCLSSLSSLAAEGAPLPAFIAIEDNSAIDELATLGYARFKLVRGTAIAACDALDVGAPGAPLEERNHSITRNRVGGMPWECINTLTGDASWSSAERTRASPFFNHAARNAPHDLFAART